ncbi:MAG: VOC family protein [Candidatus Acidiferrales bacterium]|jgi:catechol 2,3-dioxygenase-like lactoylglutathione lyase family enzyme
MEHVIAEMLRNFEQGKITRRQLIQSLAMAATASSAASAAPAMVGGGPTPMKATYLNHVGYRVTDHSKTSAWYAEVFGLKVVLDDGMKTALAVGESQLIFHNRQTPGQLPADHVALTIENWDTDKSVRPAVSAEIKRRGIEVKRETECCIHIKDLDGFEVQLGGKNQ